MPMHKKDPECSLSLLLIPLEGEASGQAWLLTLVDGLEHCPSFLGYMFFLGMFKQEIHF